jgi:hypothetical protein
MSDCTKCREHMIDALYGELAPVHKDLYDRHIAACPECAAEHAALAETLSLMAKRERRDPGPEFWGGYWDRLSRRMLWEATEEGRGPSLAARIGRVFGRVFARLPRWAYQTAGAAALLLVGILIGSRLIGPSGTATTGAPGTTAAVFAPAASGAVAQAGDFIERSKVLLLGLVNFDPAVEDAYAFDLGGKKAASRVLAAEAPAIRKGLNEPGQRRLRELVGELEVIMMQIANLEAGQDVDGIELVRQGVDSRGIFLKIDLDRMARDARPAPAGGAAKPVKKSQV